MIVESLQLSSAMSAVNAFAVWTNRATGQAWNGSAFVTRTAANLILGATTGTFDFSGYVGFAVPSGVALIVYDVAIYQQAGPSPATGDITTTLGSGGATPQIIQVVPDSVVVTPS